MKKLIPTFAVLLLAGALAQAEAVVGKPAPVFAATDIEGKVHKLADFAAKIVVLEAYNADCPFCANHYRTGAMQELQSWATAKGVVWLVVNSVNANHPNHRDRTAAKKEFAAQKMKANAWIDDTDGAVGKAYGLKTTPHLVIIDKAGLVAYDGAIDDKPDSEADPHKARCYVREALQSLLASESVKVKTTKPYGCSVKY